MSTTDKKAKTIPARSNGKHPGGRPQIYIDETEFEKLCQLQCTKEEIAGWYHCSEDTIDRWCNKTYGASFAVVFSQKRAGGKISLRRAQFELAKKNAAMAIFLGKNYLGQKDNFEEVDTTALDKLDDILKGIHSNAANSVQRETK